MKQFIVLMAVLPILMVFMMQMGLDQKNNGVTSVIQASVYAAKEEAKQAGCFTDEIKKDMVAEISRLTGIGPEKVTVEADATPKYRYASGDGKLIHYKVTVKIDKLMAANKLYGIEDKENGYDYVIESYTASEYL